MRHCRRSCFLLQHLRLQALSYERPLPRAGWCRSLRSTRFGSTGPTRLGAQTNWELWIRRQIQACWNRSDRSRSLLRARATTLGQQYRLLPLPLAIQRPVTSLSTPPVAWSELRSPTRVPAILPRRCQGSQLLAMGESGRAQASRWLQPI